MSDDFNLFLVFAPNVAGYWTITCSKVTIESGHRVTEMSNVVPIGSGLNAIAQLNKSDVIELLAYLKTLQTNKIGHFDNQIWRLA